MKYFFLLLLASCSSFSFKNQISKEDFCAKNKITNNCDLIYSYYLANNTIFKQNKELDQFIIQHQP